MRRSSWLPLIALVLAAAGSSLAGKLEDAVDQGNQAYARQQYKEALEQYQIAETERPESPELEYNIAGVLHNQQKYEEAVERYTKALNSEDVGITADAHFNLGNTKFRMGDYAGAISSYEESLRLRPDDMDAKFNLELARRLLKDQMQNQSQDNQDQQQQQEQQQEQQQQQQQDQQQDQQDQQDQQQQSEQDQQENQDSQQQQQQPQPQDKPMSKEDAERILNALQDEEQNVQNQVRRQVIGGNYIGNDW